MRISRLKYIAHELNAALGSGRFHDISYDEVWERIDNGTIFTFLSNRLDLAVPLSVLGPVDRIELLVEWEEYRGCVEPFRFDGHRSGLCLLVAYLLEGILRRARDPRYRLLPEKFDAALLYDNRDVEA